MSKRIYVGGLPYSTTEQELQELFSSQGEVSKASVVTDRESGQSKGFGFVEMTNDEEAEKAIASLNGTLVGNRNIVVNEARPKEERNSFGTHGGGGFNRRQY